MKVFLRTLSKFFIIGFIYVTYSLQGVALAKTNFAEFSSFYFSYIFSHCLTVRDFAKASAAGRKVQLKYLKALNKQNLKTKKIPIVKGSGSSITFTHGKRKVEFNFVGIKKGFFSFNGQSIPASQEYSFVKALEVTKKIIGKEFFYQDYAPFYAYLTIVIQKYITRFRYEKGPPEWISYMYFSDFGLMQRFGLKGQSTTSLTLKCRGRELSMIKLEDYFNRWKTTAVLSSLEWHRQTKGYIYRTRLPKCATYLTSGGAVRVTYQGCPAKGTRLFEQSPFFNFAKFGRACCEINGCERTVNKALLRERASLGQ